MSHKRNMKVDFESWKLSGSFRTQNEIIKATMPIIKLTAIGTEYNGKLFESHSATLSWLNDLVNTGPDKKYIAMYRSPCSDTFKRIIQSEAHL